MNNRPTSASTVAVVSAAVVIVTNPVDLLTSIAIECSARPKHLIMGIGTLVDTARLRYQLATALGAEPVDAYAAVGVDRLVLPPRPEMDAAALERFAAETSRALGLTA
jgi:hypothetical protein